MIEFKPTPNGRPLPPWKMPRSFNKWLINLPEPDALFNMVEGLSKKSEEHTIDSHDRVRVASYNDGAGNGYDIVCNGQGTILYALDHETHTDPIYKEEILEIIPPILRSTIPVAKFSLIEEDCPVGIIAWRLHGQERWHAGFAQKDIDIVKQLAEQTSA